MGSQLKVLGIDPSITSTGITYLEYKDFTSDNIREIITYTITPDKEPSQYRDRFKRYNELLGKIDEVLCTHGSLDIAVIEGYSMGSTGRSILNLAEFGGLLRELIISSKIPLVEVAPTRLKKFILKGNAGKEEVHEKLKAHFPIFEPLTCEDELDAAVAAVFGIYFLRSLHNELVDWKELKEDTVLDEIAHMKMEERKYVVDQRRDWNIKESP